MDTDNFIAVIAIVYFNYVHVSYRVIVKKQEPMQRNTKEAQVSFS